jgi:hypothetical protein
MDRPWSFVTRDKGSLSSLPRDRDERERLKQTVLVLYSWELASELSSLSESEPGLESESESASAECERRFL